MIRRLFLLLALLCAAPLAAAAPAVPDPVHDAFLFGFPVYEIARTRAAALQRQPVNYLAHRRTLADAATREVTTPNNDTLYSSAWLDLRAGPVVLTLPALPGRYHSAALMDLFTDNFAILGTRTSGGKGGRFAIAGPDYTGAAPPGATLVRAPTDDVWLLVRILVDGRADLDAAQRAQDGFRLEPPAPSPLAPPAILPAKPDAPAFVDGVGAALARGPVPPRHRGRLSRFASTGLRPGATWASLSPAQQAMWRDAFPALLASLREGLAAGADVRAGWAYPKAGIGDFGQDDLLRAQVALGGLAALPPAEAMYLTARTDTSGAPLDASHTYRLRIPAGGVPVNGFWSLTLYEVEPDGRLFFADNPLGRYAIGDRSPGLLRQPHGGIDIRIGGKDPGGAMRANWLPAPDSGPIRLTLRAYLAKPALLGGKWKAPGLERLN